MALRAKTTDYWDLPSGDAKRQISVRVVIYDDGDDNQTPLGQPIDISVDLDGFLTTSKSDSARQHVIQDAVKEQAADLVGNLEKSAIAVKSLVGIDFALSDD